MDVRERVAVDRLLAELRPDVIYHFAGQAYVVPSWGDPEGTFQTNVLGTLNLLEAVRKHCPATRFAFAGSGTEYGDADQTPTPEGAPLRPTSPYASSKAAADLLCYQYYRSFGIPVLRYRIFGTTGPGKIGDSICDFARQIATIENNGLAGVLRVGNLDTVRDVSDVRDAVRALVLVVERGVPGDAYNIGSGVPRLVQETLASLVGMSGARLSIQTDKALLRQTDEPVHLAAISKITALGWSPKYNFRQTLGDILDSWRARTMVPAPLSG